MSDSVTGTVRSAASPPCLAGLDSRALLLAGPPRLAQPEYALATPVRPAHELAASARPAYALVVHLVQLVQCIRLLVRLVQSTLWSSGSTYDHHRLTHPL